MLGNLLPEGYGGGGMAPGSFKGSFPRSGTLQFVLGYIPGSDLKRGVVVEAWQGGARSLLCLVCV